MNKQTSETRFSKLRQRFVATIYATHNSSPRIESALARCLARLQGDDIGLNIGAGSTRLHPKVLNLDITPGPNIDFCARAESLPCDNDSFALIISQETLEHVQDPVRAVQEMHRVLKPGGTLYCQLPFVIGYHPGPTDFWRFTREGIRELIQSAGFECQELGIAVGPGTGFYRIAVEFFALVAASLVPRSYYPTKATMALLLYPIKWLDRALTRTEQADRIAGGYYVIARKTPAGEQLVVLPPGQAIALHR